MRNIWRDQFTVYCLEKPESRAARSSTANVSMRWPLADATGLDL